MREADNSQIKKATCPKCGADAFYKTKGHLYELTCGRCNYSESGTFYPGDDKPEVKTKLGQYPPVELLEVDGLQMLGLSERAMKTYETSATVEDQGQILVTGVPFAPGTEVEIAISPKMQSAEEVISSDEGAVAAARERMRELFSTIKGFRNSPRIPREELYERGRVR